MSLLVFSAAQRLSIFDFKTKSQAVFNSKYIYTTILYEHNIVTSIDCEHLSRITCCLLVVKGLPIYYVSSYNKAGSFRMLTNAYRREQGFIQKVMSYENPI